MNLFTEGAVISQRPPLAPLRCCPVLPGFAAYCILYWECNCQHNKIFYVKVLFKICSQEWYFTIITWPFLWCCPNHPFLSISYQHSNRILLIVFIIFNLALCVHFSFIFWGFVRSFFFLNDWSWAYFTQSV